MISVKGKIKNGVALPLEPVNESDEGRNVIITFVDEEAEETERPNGADHRVSLKSLIDEFQVDTGIEDLASQHDHYLYGTPKKWLMAVTFVDTVAWIALANTRDSLHSRARDIFGQLWDNETHFLTSEFVLVELANALSSSAIRSQTAAFIRSLNLSRSIEIIPSSTELFYRGLELFESRTDKDWGLVDCTSFVIMTERSVNDVFTEDHHFTQAGFTALL